MCQNQLPPLDEAQYWEEANAAIEAMRSDPEIWAEELKEREALKPFWAAAFLLNSD
jgi:hypothetical protein